MPPRGKRFDRNKAVTFRFVPRSQDDPLNGDPNAGQFLLALTHLPKNAASLDQVLAADFPREIISGEEKRGGEFIYSREGSHDEHKQKESDNIAEELEWGEDDEEDFEEDIEEDYARSENESANDHTVPRIRSDSGGRIESKDAGPSGRISHRPAGDPIAHPYGYDYNKHFRPITGVGTFLGPNGERVDPLREAAVIPAIPENDPDLAEIEKEEKKRVVTASKRSDATVFSAASSLNLPVVKPGKHAVITEDFLEALEVGNEQGFLELEDDFFKRAMESGSDSESVEENASAKSDEELEPCPDVIEREGIKVSAIRKPVDTERLGQDASRAARLEAQLQEVLKEFEGTTNEGDNAQIEEGQVRLKEYDQEMNELVVKSKMTAATAQSDKAHVLEAIRAQAKSLEVEAQMSSSQVSAALNAEYKKQQREQWDCESIVSTYTSTENIPALIKEARVKPGKSKIKLSRDLGIPVGMMRKHREERNARNSEAAKVEQNGPGEKGYAPHDDCDAESGASRSALPDADAVAGERGSGNDIDVEEEVEEGEELVDRGERRPAGESKEEKKVRKAAVKALRAQQRALKRETKMAFERESQMQQKITLANKNSNPPHKKL